MAQVKAVCISEQKGEQKHEVAEAYLRVNHGIEGDAHAGDWHRQVSLLGEESINKIRPLLDFPLANGAFAENIVTAGLTLYELPVGAKLQLGEAVGEVTQIGKKCHNDGCAIKRATGDCVMPREGIFIKVLEPGYVRAGDEIIVL